MKKFILYVSSLLVFVCVASVALDYFYTYVYYNCPPRDNVSWVQQMNKEDTLDYILIGSSRCINHLNPELIEKTTGKKGLNLGSPGFEAVETKLMLLLALEKLNFEAVYVQIDYMYNNISPSKFAYSLWMPFIKQDLVFSEYKKYGSQYSMYYYLPFYRYQKNDPKIGFRNVCRALISKQNTEHKTGFTAQNGVKSNANSTYFIDLEKVENPIYKDIQKVCKDRNIDVFFYTSPVFNDQSNYALFDNYFDNYFDFSDSIPDVSLFANQTHLNYKGANKFTKQFCNYYFPQSSISQKHQH